MEETDVPEHVPGGPDGVAAGRTAAALPRRPAFPMAALLLACAAVAMIAAAAIFRPDRTWAAHDDAYPSTRAIAPLVAADGLPPTPSPTPTPTPSPTPVGPAIYLTFDDGPDPRWTPEVLRALEEFGAEATFFVVGTLADRYPDLVASAASQGHAVGIHGYSHTDLGTLSPPEITAELAAARAVVEATTGRPVVCMRPPYGTSAPVVRDVAASMQLDYWMWTVDPWDWKRPGALTISSRVIGSARPGSVVLLHDGGGDRSQTVAALRTILSSLTARGYIFARLPC
jgi:peptidoglycan/xylan/chitin deacetylase (PgdA/CDA1 family)